MVWYMAVATHELPHAIIYFLLLLLLIMFFFLLLSSFSMYYVCFVRLGFVVEGTGINGCVKQNRSRQAEVSGRLWSRIQPQAAGITRWWDPNYVVGREVH